MDGIGLSREGYVLMGHSLGGYLSGRFLTKFKADSGVRGLILLSAAGLAPHPPAEELTDKSALPSKAQWLHYLWDSDFTPLHAIRAMGTHPPTCHYLDCDFPLHRTFRSFQGQ